MILSANLPPPAPKATVYIMNTRPERLDKDGFPIPAGFDNFDPAGSTSKPRGPAVRRALRWLVLVGMLAAAWVHFDVGNYLRNKAGEYLCHEAIRQYRQNNLQGALASLDRAVGWAPNNGQVVALRMQLHLELRNWEAALGDSYRAAELEEGDNGWVEGRLSALQGLRRHRETAAFCGEMLRRARGSRITMLNSRAYARAHGEFELNEALDDIQEAIAAGRVDVDLPAESLSTDAALRMHNLRAALIDTRGYVLLKLGKNEEALVDFEKAIAHSEAALAEQGRKIKDDRLRGVPRGTIERRSKQFDEGRAAIVYHRGQAYEKLGRKAEAQADFAEARSLGYDEAQGVY
jgi:tetratricopeptide (TPR) repeat protein